MKVTVKDCLELAAFDKADVLAGENNLTNLVKKVTVLDVYTAKEIKKHCASENQMVLTSFSPIRSDEDAQCKVIRALAEGKNVALVVFHVGDIVKYMSDKAIVAAEKVGLPLIRISEDSVSDMGDTINQVTSRLFYEKDQQFSNALITNTIFHLLNFEKYSSFQSAVRAAALSNDFQLIILSEDFNPILSVETRHRTTIAEAIRLGKERSVEKQPVVYTMIDVNGVLTYWGPVYISEERYFMFIVDNEDSFSAGEISKLAEIIELAMGMWGYTPQRDLKAEFIRALQRGNTGLARSLENDVMMEDQRIYSVFFLEGGDVHKALRNIDEYQGRVELDVLCISEEEEAFGMVIGTEEDTEGQSLCNGLYESLKGNSDTQIFHVTGLYGYEGAEAGYSLIGETRAFARTVFPYKRIFTKYEMTLVSNCISIQLRSDHVKSNYAELLESFNGGTDNKGKQLLETLEIFVLDAGMNSGKTAELMGIHNNTVQYRLKKINEILGVEITGNRVVPGLTMALAMKRLGRAVI